MGRSSDEFHYNTDKGTNKGKGLKFFGYGENLRYDSEGIYSYGTKIGNLDLGIRTIQKLGFWSPNSSTHYNYYAERMLGECHGFNEIENAPSGNQIIHCQNLVSYDDHT